MAGTLYVVATPLGNLGDLTGRAAEVLRQVRGRRRGGHPPEPGAAESPRRPPPPDQLPRPLSGQADRHAAGTPGGGRRRGTGTDAGTPGVSDPGAELVAAARAAGVRVVPIPGVSAVTTALSASGLPADRYLFLGFLPRKGSERRRLLAQAAAAECTVVLLRGAAPAGGTARGPGRGGRRRAQGRRGAGTDQDVRGVPHRNAG